MPGRLLRRLGRVLTHAATRPVDRRRGLATAGAVVAAVTLGLATPGPLHAAAATPAPNVVTGAAGVARTPDGGGYWVATTYGAVLAFGDAADLGQVTGSLNRPIVGIVATHSGQGFWLIASDGGVFPFGNAPGLGSTGGISLNRPVVGMAATSDDGGYWIVASDGGVFPFGNAGGHGSTGGIALNQPIISMAATHSNSGYWLFASDGGVFPFGDAAGYGSTGNVRLNRPMVTGVATEDGAGYWLIASDGGVFPFGDAAGWGSLGAVHLNAPIDGAAVAATQGYWLLARDGGIFPFGPGAAGFGSAAGHVRYQQADVASRPECGVPASIANRPGKVIVIALACQGLTGYQDGSPLYVTDVTTGRPELPTPPGSYSVLRRNSPWHMVSDWPTSSPYWYPPTWVQYTLWFRSDGYAIHDAPWRSTYGPGTNLQGSHGCVNTPMPIMQALYGWADLGTPVIVV